MPHPTKKQRIECHERNEEVAAAEDDFLASFDDLSIDVLANILAFLSLKEIMSKRRINKKSREAVKKTIVPPTDFCVGSVEEYNAMAVMARAMPNLQQITLRSPDIGHKYNDGEDPDEELTVRNANYTSHDIEIVSNFSKLRILKIRHAPLNGRYPVLFNFSLLQKLFVNAFHLKWDLEMLAGFPLLKEVECWYNTCMTGNTTSLAVLKDTLETVKIYHCENVEGNLMDLADFPHLKELDLSQTAVRGDVRDIGASDFSSLQELNLDKGVYGGRGHELQRISDAPDVARAVYCLKKQRPTLSIWKFQRWFGILSSNSPDRFAYAYNAEIDGAPPFYIRFVEAASRTGYRWECKYNNPCEVNWLDPEPDRESGDYAKYMEELEQINAQVDLYKGFHQPPTEEEYHRVVEEHTQRHVVRDTIWQ